MSELMEGGREGERDRGTKGEDGGGGYWVRGSGDGGDWGEVTVGVLFGLGGRDNSERKRFLRGFVKCVGN